MKKNPELKKKKNQAIQNFKPRPMTSRIPPERVKLINIIRKMTIQRANAQIQRQKKQIKNSKRNDKKEKSTNSQKVQQKSKDDKRKDSKSKENQIDSSEKFQQSSIQSIHRKVQIMEQVHMSKGLRKNMILKKNPPIQIEINTNNKNKSIEESKINTRNNPLMQIQGQNHRKNTNKSRVKFVQHKNEIYVSETMYQFIGEDNIQISAYVQPSAKELDRLIKLNKAGKQPKPKKVKQSKQIEIVQKTIQTRRTRSLRGSNPFARHQDEEDELCDKENYQGGEYNEEREIQEQEIQNGDKEKIQELQLEDSFIYDHLEENFLNEMQTILIQTSPRRKSNTYKNQEKTQSHKKQAGSGKSSRKIQQEKLFGSIQNQRQQHSSNQQQKVILVSQNHSESLFKKQSPKIHVHKIIEVENSYQNEDFPPNSLKQSKVHQELIQTGNNEKSSFKERNENIQENNLLSVEGNNQDLSSIEGTQTEFIEKKVRRSKRLSQRSKTQEKVICQLAFGSNIISLPKISKPKSNQSIGSNKCEIVEATLNPFSVLQTVKLSQQNNPNIPLIQNKFLQKQHQLLSSSQEIQLLNQPQICEENQQTKGKENKKSSKSSRKNKKNENL